MKTMEIDREAEKKRKSATTKQNKPNGKTINVKNEKGGERKKFKTKSKCLIGTCFTQG